MFAIFAKIAKINSAKINEFRVLVLLLVQVHESVLSMGSHGGPTKVLGPGKATCRFRIHLVSVHCVIYVLNVYCKNRTFFFLEWNDILCKSISDPTNSTLHLKTLDLDIILFSSTFLPWYARNNIQKNAAGCSMIFLTIFLEQHNLGCSFPRLSFLSLKI